MFLHLFVILLTGGMRGCSWGGRHGYSWRGMCGCSWGGVVALGDMHGCSQGACMVTPGGMCVVVPGACVVTPGGGMCGCSQGGHAWLLLWVHGCSGGHTLDMTRYGDTVIEQAVCILLECILV